MKAPRTEKGVSQILLRIKWPHMLAVFLWLIASTSSPVFAQAVASDTNIQPSQNSYSQYLRQLEGAPQQRATINPKVLALMQLLANLELAQSANDKSTATSALVSELENSSLIVTSNPIVLDAYSRLIDNAMANGDFSRADGYASDLIRLYQIQQCDNCRSIWRVYFKRGVSRFRYGVSRPSRSHNWQKPTTISFWIDALLDIRRARVIYGSPRDNVDPDYYGMVAWDLAINSFIDSNQRITDTIEGELTHNIINPSAAIVRTYRQYSTECAPYGRSAPTVNLENRAGFEAVRFGGAVGLYDLGINGTPINIRIIAIEPNTDLLPLALEAVANSRFPISKENVPDICKTNRIAVIKFKTKANN